MEIEPLENLSFEDAFNRLEEAVTRLEEGGMTIEDMVARFEEGMALVKLCNSRLDTAQARVRMLLGDDPDTESTDPDAFQQGTMTWNDRDK